MRLFGIAGSLLLRLCPLAVLPRERTCLGRSNVLPLFSSVRSFLKIVVWSAQKILCVPSFVCSQSVLVSDHWCSSGSLHSLLRVLFCSVVVVMIVYREHVGGKILLMIVVINFNFFFFKQVPPDNTLRDIFSNGRANANKILGQQQQQWRWFENGFTSSQQRLQQLHQQWFGSRTIALQIPGVLFKIGSNWRLKFYDSVSPSLLPSFSPSLWFPNHIRWSGEQLSKRATLMLLKTWWKLKV